MPPSVGSPDLDTVRAQQVGFRRTGPVLRTSGAQRARTGFDRQFDIAEFAVLVVMRQLQQHSASTRKTRGLSQINRLFRCRAAFSNVAEYIVRSHISDTVTMSNEVKDNLKSQSTWIRGLYMLIYIVCYKIAEIVLYAIIVFQFLLKLITAETNERLCKLSQGISTYIYQILQFLNFNSEYQPYPFGAWPKGEPKALKQATAEEASASDS